MVMGFMARYPSGPCKGVSLISINTKTWPNLPKQRFDVHKQVILFLPTCVCVRWRLCGWLMTSFPQVKYSRWDLITVSNLGDTGNDVLCKTNHHTWLFLGLRSLKYRNFQIKTKKKRERERGVLMVLSQVQQMLVKFDSINQKSFI